MIIGMTGTIGAGKGTVVDFLKKRGFSHYSVREFLIEEIKKRGLEINRESMVYVANKLREENSPSYIVEKLYERVGEKENSVIESLRTLSEIKSLKEKGNFFLISVDASPEIRYKRIIERNSETDNIEFEQFLRDEIKEMQSDDPNKQNLKACIDAADVKISNNGSLEDLERDVEELLLTLGFEKNQGKRKDYISWDDYFMGIALLSARRSKDPNTQTGACIVNPSNIIVGTGYNGFPIGCSDELLPWAREGKPLETKYPFVCHAELNAILNSSTSLKECRIYVPLIPCGECAKAIIQSGIKEVIYMSDKYSGEDLFKASRIMFEQSGIKLIKHVAKIDSLKLDFSSEKV